LDYEKKSYTWTKISGIVAILALIVSIVGFTLKDYYTCSIEQNNRDQGETSSLSNEATNNETTPSLDDHSPIEEGTKIDIENENVAQEQVDQNENLQLNVGEIITLGKYPQNGTSDEPIGWIVLSIEGNKAILITEKALESMPYNTECTEITWEFCSLRQWLNNDFYNYAFNYEEKECIVETVLSNTNNPYYGTYGGNSTVDKVFCLSVDEVLRYLPNDIDRCAEATPHAINNGAYSRPNNDTFNGNCWWWLRTPGADSTRAADSNSVGDICGDGLVDYTQGAVRPAIVISLN